MKKMLLFALLILLVFGLPAHAHALDNNPEITINITNKGFSPDSVKIPAGTAVVLVNKDIKPHWPASDLHPTHTRYPGSGIEKCGTSEEKHILDACDGLKTDGSFSFHFDEAGRWSLHDHLNPNLKMAVEVVGSENQNKYNQKSRLSLQVIYQMLKNFLTPAAKSDKKSAKDPDKNFEPEISVKELAAQSRKICYEGQYKNVSEKLPCYSKQFENISFENGPDFAFQVLDELQRIDETAKTCHVIAHGIGWGAYKRNPDDWKELVANINPTCVYGALHGILERHVQSLPDKKITKEVISEFCESNPHPGCIHAVGHLLLVETENNIDDAIKFCYEYPTRNYQRHYCLTGIFMENMIGDNLFQHGIYDQARRTRWYVNFSGFEGMCRSQEGENATACWEEIIHASAIHFKGDPVRVFEHCNTAQTFEGAKLCKRHAIGDLVSMNKRNLSKLKFMCSIRQENDSSFEGDCYSRMASSVAFSSPPEYMAPVVDFCSSLGNKFQSSCFLAIGGILKKRRIPADKIEKLCGNVHEFKEQCLGNDGRFLSDDKESELPQDNRKFDAINKALELMDYCNGLARAGNTSNEICYSKKFEEVSFEEGSKKAFEVLDALQDIDKDSLKCHFIAHGIGHGIYRRNPAQSISQLGRLSNFCSYGAPMGIIEKYTTDFLKGNLAGNLQKICDNSSPTGCNHILGHMLMVENNADINKSLAECVVFNGSRQRLAQCFRGIFMENIEQRNLIAHGLVNMSLLNTPSRNEELEELCGTFQGERKIACWASLPKVLLIKHRNNISAVFDSCDSSSDSKAALECKIEAVGLLEISNNFDLNKSRKYCSLDYDAKFEQQCYNNLVEGKLNVLGQKGLDSIDFCSSLDKRFVKSCFAGVRMQLYSIYKKDMNKITEACKRAPKEFFDDCAGISSAK